jgi:hypothetical protein
MNEGDSALHRGDPPERVGPPAPKLRHGFLSAGPVVHGGRGLPGVSVLIPRIFPGRGTEENQVRCGAAPPSPGVHLALLPLKRYPRVEPSAPSSFHLTVLSPGPPVLLASPKSEPRTTTRAGAAGTRPVRTRLSLLAFATKGKGPPPIDSGEWPGRSSSSSLSASFRSDRLAVVASCA